VEEEVPKKLLEIGPGAGAITKYLLQFQAVDFKAIELDEEKVAYLQHTYPGIRGKVIHQSFLDALNLRLKVSSWWWVTSLITSLRRYLFKILEWKTQVPLVVGMFQKEVAQRVAAKEGSKTYGILSVLVQAFYEVSYLFDVHENCFNPPPKVKSGVIKLRIRTQVPEMKSEKAFFLLVKTAFNQRRKMLTERRAFLV
jgi:16S rRNA (adenine1518-N6/adenine1519-N6)-dimethyltransferase